VSPENSLCERVVQWAFPISGILPGMLGADCDRATRQPTSLIEPELVPGTSLGSSPYECTEESRRV